MKRVPLRDNTKIRDGHFFSRSAARATKFADRANKDGYNVMLSPAFGKVGWEIDVSDWKRR